MEEEKKVCCEDGTCSLCTKKEEIETTDNNSEKNVIEEKSHENKKVTAISEADKEKIKEEVKKVEKRKKQNNNSRDFKMDRLKKADNKKSPVNKALILVLIVVIAASIVAGVMAVNFFNEFKGDKISKKMFEGTEVVELDGQTWILETEPKVIVKVFTSADCGEDCNVDDIVSFLKIQMPTLEVKEIDVASSDVDFKYVPAFAFDENVIETDFYSRAEELFTEENGKYFLQVAQIDFSVKQLAEMSDDIGFMVGSKDAGVSVIAVTDFGCKECAIANPILDKLEVEYKNKAKFTYKIYTDVENEKMMSVSMAAFCADEQDKFDAYADNLFARQGAWMAIEGDLTTVLGNYAANLRLDKAKFNECLTSKKYEDDLVEMNKEIMDYGFTSVPVYFIAGERIDGVPTYEGVGAIMKKVVNATN